jgi:hypothetical protein
MGFQSQSGHMIFRTQAVGGTYQADTGTAGVGTLIRSGTLSSNRDLLIPDPEIGGGRDVNDAYLGPVSWSGDVEFYARMNSLGTLLKGALGSAAAGVPAAAPNAAAISHVITPVDATALPWLSIEEAVANGFETFRYTDAKVNTFHLEADANGFLMGSAGLLGLTQAEGAMTATNLQRWDTSPLIVGTNVTVQYGGVTLPAKSFSLDLTNNIEDDDFRLGSLFLGDAVEKRREVTLGLGIRPADATLWKQATYGLPAATQAGGLTTKEDMLITLTTYEVVTGASVTPYSCSFVVPAAIIAPFAVEPSGDDVIEHDIEIRAVRPNVAVPIITATVVNDKATLA